MQVGLYGSYDGNHPLDYQLVLDGALGYFVIDNLEITGLLGWQSNELSDNLQAGLGTRYHFTFGSPWVPFVELAVLYAATELDDSVYNDFDSPDWDAWLLRAGAGIQYFFTDSVALSLKVFTIMPLMTSTRTRMAIWTISTGKRCWVSMSTSTNNLA